MMIAAQNACRVGIIRMIDLLFTVCAARCNGCGVRQSHKRHQATAGGAAEEGTAAHGQVRVRGVCELLADGVVGVWHVMSDRE